MLQASKCACFLCFYVYIWLQSVQRNGAQLKKEEKENSDDPDDQYNGTSTFTHTIIQTHNILSSFFLFIQHVFFVFILILLDNSFECFRICLLCFLFHTFSGSQHKKNLFFISHSMLIAYYFASFFLFLLREYNIKIHNKTGFSFFFFFIGVFCSKVFLISLYYFFFFLLQGLLLARFQPSVFFSKETIFNRIQYVCVCVLVMLK